MNRRDFAKTSALALGAGSLPGLGTAFAAGPKMSRLACTTTTFRGRFPKMSLLEVPEFFAKQLGIAKVEIWSRHFTDDSPGFCAKLKAAADSAGSSVINIQLDQPGYNLSDPDKAGREKSIGMVKTWMERAKICGASSLRANTGGGKGQKFVAELTADSFRQLADHGRDIGVKILVENHGGHSAKAENIAEIIRRVASPWCRSLPDFGNFTGTQEERHAFLKILMPSAHLISTKGMDFDKQLKHSPYDIGACVRVAEATGFKGVYSIEQWSQNPQPVDDLSIAKRILAIILENLA